MLTTTFWRPTAFKINWVDFKISSPNGIPMVLLHIVDRLEPQDYIEGYYPLHFDYSVQPYIKYLLQQGIIVQGKDPKTFELVELYREGSYHEISITEQLSCAISDMLNKAELLPDKVFVGKMPKNYVAHFSW